MHLNHEITMPEYDFKRCKYNPRTMTERRCSTCQAGLCRICGYVLDGKDYCNECYVLKIKEN